MSIFQELLNGLDFKAITKRAWQGAAIAFALLATWLILLIAKGEDFGLWVALPFTTVTIGGLVEVYSSAWWSNYGIPTVGEKFSQ